METVKDRILNGTPEQREHYLRLLPAEEQQKLLPIVEQRCPYKVEKMADSRWLLHFKKAINGQRITVELTRCTTSKTQKAMWKEKTAKRYVPATYWRVKVEAYDQDENCHSWYNPTVRYEHYEEIKRHTSIWRPAYNEIVKGTNCTINFDWLLEATASNAQKILAEVERMATEGIKTLC